MLFTSTLSVSLILFTVIDIPGSLPIILNLKKQGLQVQAGRTTLIAGLLMLLFLFFGTSVLDVFGIEVASFALAGSLIIFFMGLEMILGIRFFRDEPSASSGAIVPLAFPIIAGAGTLTTILSLKSKFGTMSILTGIILNLLLVFLALRSTGWLERKIGDSGLEALRKIFGIIIIAVAIQMFRSNLGV